MPDGAKNRALVIDDDAGLLKIISAQLADFYDVAVAESGAAALDALEYFSPDIILLDIDMPEMDGYETLAKLRGDPRTKDVPVIFLTGMDGVDDQVRGLRSGARDYVTKPFARDVLLARMALHINDAAERRGEREARKQESAVEIDEREFALRTKKLNDGEKKTARLLALGYSYREISDSLSYSFDGVKKLAVKIFDKTGFSDRYELRKALTKK
jgi:DNA-binding response OmpR family regulator